jgi:hypothetical protein
VAHDFGDFWSERVPWLERTDFPSHLARLQDKEIKSSYQLPPKKVLDAITENAEEPDLVRILVAAKGCRRLTSTLGRSRYRRLFWDRVSDSATKYKM